MIKKILLFLFIAVFFISCTNTDNDRISSDRYCLGTYCTITIYGKYKNADKIFEQVWNRIELLENRISCKLENSTVTAINNGINKKIDDDTEELLKTAKLFFNLTDGAFSPYLKLVSDLWGIGTDNAKVPSDDEIKEKLKFRQIDLGAIGKGYASDLARDILVANGVKSAVINFGGNVCCVGCKPDGNEFVVGLQEPDAQRGVFRETVQVKDLCVITSGDYERYFEEDGIRYCHILDGRTGYPVRNGVRAVSVIGNNGLICDALSTSCFILGEEQSVMLLENFPQYKVRFFK